MVISTSWELGNFEKIWNLVRADHINELFDAYGILLKLRLQDILHCTFFSFHMTWCLSNKAVQEVVPLILYYVNIKSWFIIHRNKKKLCCKESFKNVNISNELFFFYRCSFIIATMCVQTYAHTISVKRLHHLGNKTQQFID